jgi:putative tail protein
MSIFRSASKQAAITPDYTGLQIQTAVSALPIPIVWGMSKIAPNVIWYNNFKAIPHGSGGGGGGKGLFSGGGGSGAQQYDYTADVILALCEGPITGINQIWRGQSIYTLSSLGLTLFPGSTPQGVWSYLTTGVAQGVILDLVITSLGGPLLISPSQAAGQIALAYQGTAYVAAANYNLSSSATLDNHNFEVEGFQFRTGYGPGYLSNDADPALIVSDFLTNAQFGVGFPLASIDQTTLFGSGGDASYQTYCRAVGLALSPALTNQEAASSTLTRWLQLTNTAAVWSGGLLRFMPYGDTSVTNLSFTFIPNVAPIYDLDDDDYIVENNADPLQVSRTDPYEAHNVWRLEAAERNNAYNLTTVESRDQNAIERYGVRIAPTVTAHEICDTNVALICGQLMLQRTVYLRNTYKFRLSWEYCLLDPMDLVTIGDPILGLVAAPVRITEIEEDENGYLQITAEEFPLGYATATLYPARPIVNNPTNRNVGVGSVNAPIIFEPTDELGGGLEIWAAVSSQTPLYGGCNVWMSLDSTGSYTQIGSLTGNSRMGVTTADLPAVGINPAGQTVDQVNTLSVDLTQSNGALASATTNAALALSDPCYLGGEIVGYADATLTAAYRYNLTYLPRGAFGTASAIVDHPAGTPFARLDSAVFQYAYNQHNIGATLYFKFQSFNVWGGGAQSLDDCTAYSYQVTGSALASPLPDVENVYTNYASGFLNIYWDEIQDFRNGIVYEIRQGTLWDTALFLKTQAHAPYTAQGNGSFLIKARCQPIAGLTVYSESPAEITISGNQLSLNLLASWDEKAAGWRGAFDNGIGVDSGNLRLGGAGNILADNPLLESLATSAATASGSALSFTNVPPTIAIGMAVADTTTAGAIPALATVLSIDYGFGSLDYGSVAAAATSSADDGSVAVSAATAVDYGAVSITATVTISAAVSGGGVLSGDTIVFSTPDVLDYGGIITDTPVYYTIPASHIVNAGSVVQASVNATTQIIGVPVGQNILAVGDFLNDPDVLGSASTQYVDGWVEIIVSQDGVTWPTLPGGAPAWQKFVPGVYPGQAWNLRLALESQSTNVIPYALAFNYTVQLPARIDHYQHQSIAAGGTTITFQRDGTTAPAAFNGGPGANGLPYYSVSWQATAGDTYTISGLSLSQLTIQFLNGGSGVARSNVNITVEGY